MPKPAGNLGVFPRLCPGGWEEIYESDGQSRKQHVAPLQATGYAATPAVLGALNVKNVKNEK